MRPAALPVHLALAHWAQHSPDALALVDEPAHYSYAELHAAAAAVAAQLRQLDLPLAGARVLVVMPKSARAIAALYGVLMAGAAYVPVDPQTPLVRLQALAQQIDALALLQDAACPLPAELAPQLPRLSLTPALFAPPPAALVSCHTSLAAPDPNATGAALAAVLFTSGSTGQPKAACISHANLSAFLDWACAEFELRAQDRLCSHAALGFDLSFFDLFAAHAVGASVLLMPKALQGQGALMRAFVQRQRASIWQSVPSALGLLIDAPDDAAAAALASLRAILFAGERMPMARLQALRTQAPAARCYNIYGCTETNNSFIYRVPGLPAPLPEPLPIGALISGMQALILDEALQPTAPGEAGLLWVAGPTLMLGYWTELQGHSAPSTRVLPDAQGRPQRFYCSQDLVRVEADGLLRFLGRADGVVKVNGYRISLLELEDCLARHPEVQEVVVLTQPDAARGHSLLAVVRVHAHATLNSLAMKRHCAAQLPPYMVPQGFLFTALAVPRNSNGKVDRQAARHLFCPQGNA